MSSSEIRQIIEEEIRKNPNIGFIKNDDFFIEISINSRFNNYYQFIVLSIPCLIIPEFLLMDKLGPKSIFSKILFIFNPLTLMFFCFIISLLFKHYLVFNLNNYEFKTSTYYLNKYHLPSLDSNFIDSREIKRILLETDIHYHYKSGKSCSDLIKITLNDDTEKELFDRQQLVSNKINSKYSHKTAIEICLLFSKCLNIEFEDRSNLKEIEEHEKKVEKSISLLPYVYASFFILIIFILYLIYFT